MRKMALCLSLCLMAVFCAGQALALEVFIPHLTGGESEWEDVLEVDNYSSTEIHTFTVNLYNGGSVVGTSTVSLGPMNYTSIKTKDIASTATCAIITYTSTDLNFRISYQNTSASGGGVAQFRAMGSASDSLAFSFANFADFISWKGMAIMNTGSSDLVVYLYALSAGEVKGANAITVPAKSRLSGVHSTFFPGLAMSDVNSIVAQAGSQNLTGISISGDSSLGKLLFTPAHSQGFNAPATSISISSSAFSQGGKIPVKYTCDGANVSPALSWSGAPGGTKSLALIVDDPDAPGGDFVHWVAYDLPASGTGLSENIPLGNTISGGGTQGVNDFGLIGWYGPCPPASHRYYFKIYALDTTLGLSAGATKAQVVSAMSGHILSQAELMGMYP